MSGFGTRGDINPGQIGAGLVNAWKVLNYTTALSFEKMALNDTARFASKHEVAVTNTGAEPVTYKFSLQPWAGVDAQSPYYYDYLVDFLGETPNEIVPKVAFPAGEFTVQPGQTRSAQ